MYEKQGNDGGDRKKGMGSRDIKQIKCYTLMSKVENEKEKSSRMNH